MRNATETALKMNIGFVTSDLYAKYSRNRTENEHGLQPQIYMRTTAEIARKTNIGFVTSDLYSKYLRNCTENEHRVCNLGFVCEILQKSHETRT